MDPKVPEAALLLAHLAVTDRTVEAEVPVREALAQVPEEEGDSVRLHREGLPGHPAVHQVLPVLPGGWAVRGTNHQAASGN